MANERDEKSFKEETDKLQPLKRTYATSFERTTLNSNLTPQCKPPEKKYLPENTFSVEILMHKANMDLIIGELQSSPEIARKEKLHLKLKEIRMRTSQMQRDPLCKKFEKNILILNAMEYKIEQYFKDISADLQEDESDTEELSEGSNSPR